MHNFANSISMAINSDYRSRRFAILSIFSIFIFVAGSYIFSLYINYTDIAFQVWQVVLYTYIAAIAVYWYLQIKPTSNPVRNFRYIQSPYTIAEKISRIAEVKKAIDIYDQYKSNSQSKYDIKAIYDYILERLDVFPLSHEYHPQNIETLDLNSNIHRELFFTSLASLEHTLQQDASEGHSNESTESAQANVSPFDLVETYTNRLKTEIELLTRRANIYITFGSAITIAAGAILFYIITDLQSLISTNNPPNIQTFTSHDWLNLAARFSLVIFVEVFAFYYLRLYRNMMDNVKFYQNEITNIEMRFMALHTIKEINPNDENALNSLVTSLSNTERNFVIDKGKTTVDLEQKKLDAEFTNSLFNNVTKLTKVVRR
ncbi:hypothetical protein [Vibrio cholerae]|uniref:hypothetical protein n=1 Tax=Vibrio cholerae TaxID=666 RepID=UPI0021DB391F|nr:hypothetical protein [Vibrio vulnificus]EKF9989431.1 hypothetical protein [Vibrio cholerae]EMA3775838.1 hypothetical protein [Vibrio cholerae]MCU8430616.1 hypothetical protein [Vibrio vulnificus]